MHTLLSTLQRHFTHLLHAWASDPVPASACADVRIAWHLIHADLGLAAWVAEAGPVRAAHAPAASAILVLTHPEECDTTPREWARQLAAAHPGHPVVLPLWQDERLRRAGIAAEVALHLLLQRLRDDGLVGAAAPMVLSADKTRELASCYAQRYHARSHADSALQHKATAAHRLAMA